MVEVICSLAKVKGISEHELMRLREKKRQKNGGFEKGYFYKGEVG
jgi:predicted house-cleaning noncanonical NTP pyrophosphatase (MazG superfamily)